MAGNATAIWRYSFAPSVFSNKFFVMGVLFLLVALSLILRFQYLQVDGRTPDETVYTQNARYIMVHGIQELTTLYNQKQTFWTLPLDLSICRRAWQDELMFFVFSLIVY